MNLAVRPATREDCRLIWEWRNDAETLAHSFNMEPISWEIHQDWYQQKLASSRSRTWLLTEGPHPVAVARFDQGDDGQVEVSFSVGLAFRGRGFAQALLQRTAPLAGRYFQVSRILAHAKETNSVSVALMRKVGFIVVDRLIMKGFPCVRMRKNLDDSSTADRYKNTIITIRARMLSTRLPGKVMRPILGKPMLELMIERLRRVRGAQQILVATTIDPSSQPIEDLVRHLNVACFRGSEEDVLDRVLKAAHSVKADLIVDTTGDCPVIDPSIIDRVIDTFKANDVDYCSNVLKRTYPRGMDVQVFPTAVLEEVARMTDDPVDREHVSLYIYNHPERFRLLNVESGWTKEEPKLRLTVDTPEDFALISQIYERLYRQKPDFDLEDILELVRCHPELREINREVRQKAVR